MSLNGLLVKKKRVRFKILLILTFISIGIFSQKTIDLNEVEISSTTKIDSTKPFAIEFINSKTINESYQGQEIPLFLDRTTSVTTSSDAGSDLGYVYMRLRGVDQTRINFTLNGVPLNEPEDQGVYFSNFPDFLSSVKDIQIQRGVGTSSYGTSSYIGSINFDSPLLTGGQYTKVGVLFGSYNTTKLFVEYNSKFIKNRFAFYCRGSILKTDGYREHSGSQGGSFFVSGLYTNQKSDIIKINMFYGQSRNEMSWIGSTLEELEINPKHNGNTKEETDKFKQLHTQVQYKHSFSKNTIITTNFYYNYLKGGYDFDLDNFLGIPYYETGFYNYSVYSNFLGNVTNFKKTYRRLTFNVGFNQNLYNRTHIGTERSLGHQYANTGYKNETSIYLKTYYDIKKIGLFFDIQYRHTSFKYDGLDYNGNQMNFSTIYWDFLSPKIGIIYKPFKNLNIYYSIGTTGREPTRTDMFSGYENIYSQDEILFTNPEYVLDNEIGIRMTNKNLFVNMNFYYMKFLNEIVLSGVYGTNGLPIRENVTNSYRTGFELELKYNYKNLGFYFNSTFGNSLIIQDGGYKIRPILSPNIIIFGDINYKLFKIWNIGLTTKHQSSSYIDFENKYKLPEFTVLNFYTSIDLGKYTTIRLWLNNITNTRYYTNGMMFTYDYENYFPLYFSQPPINYKISLTFKI